MRVLYVSATHGTHDRRFLTYLRDAPHIDSGFLLIAHDHQQEKARRENERRGEHIWLIDGRQTEQTTVNDIRAVVSAFQPDVVHAGPIPSVTYLAARADAPGLTGMSWGYDLLLDAKESNEVAHRACQALARCRAFIADCETVRKAAIDLGMDRARTVVLPWGVDIDTFSPGPSDRSVRAQHGIPEDATVFFTNRAWEPLYRVDVVIQAFDLVAGNGPNVWLLIAGDGSLAPGIRARIASSPARHRIVETGRLASAPMIAHYRNSDVYVSAARIDGSSVSLLEAMACGLPAIVVDHAANREWVVEGENGWRFVRDDASDLARSMSASVAAADDRRRMGAVARDTATRRANWTRNRSKLDDAYRLATR